MRNGGPAPGSHTGRAILQILKEPEVDCAVDCVGFEARGHGGNVKLMNVPQPCSIR